MRHPTDSLMAGHHDSFMILDTHTHNPNYVYLYIVTRGKILSLSVSQFLFL